jgi:hypothetical protein
MASSSNSRNGDILAPNFQHGFLELQEKGAINNPASSRAYHHERAALVVRVPHNARVIVDTPFTSTLEWSIDKIKQIVCIFDEAACARAHEVVMPPLSL